MKDIWKPILQRESDFLIVKHRGLNNLHRYDLKREIDETLSLSGQINGRTPQLVLEGDIIQEHNSGEPVFSHKLLYPLFPHAYKKLRGQNRATPLDEVIEAVVPYKDQVALCVETRPLTRQDTLERTMRELTQAGIRFYVDSFFGNQLDDSKKLSERLGLDVPTSMHLIGRIGTVDPTKLEIAGRYPKTLNAFANTGKFFRTYNEKVGPVHPINIPVPFVSGMPRNGYDIITVPNERAIETEPTEPLIYGTVGTLEQLKARAEHPNSKGAYARFGEKNILKMAVTTCRNV